MKYFLLATAIATVMSTAAMASDTTAPLPRPYPGFQLESGELLRSGPGVSAREGALYVECGRADSAVNFRDRDGHWYQVPMPTDVNEIVHVGENEVRAYCA